MHWNPFRRAPRNPDFDREIAFHVEQLTQDGIKAGLSSQEALDPATYIGVLALILLVATAASLLPAWRSARVDPVQILRQE